MIYQNLNFGAQPSGKAAVFDTAILGSNPSAPATNMFDINFNFINKIKKTLFPFYKNKELKFVFNKLQEDFSTDTVTARFVGGCVRKYLSNDEIDDIDIATILSTEEIKEKFKNTSFKVIETGIKHGTITLVSEKLKLEITTLLLYIVLKRINLMIRK